MVLAVGSCDPAGLERLIRGLAELADALPGASPRVVLNRCRPSVGSTDQAAAAVDRFAGATVAGRLPEDRAGTDSAWRAGVSLAEAAPRSPLRVAVEELLGAGVVRHRDPRGGDGPPWEMMTLWGIRQK